MNSGAHVELDVTVDVEIGVESDAEPEMELDMEPDMGTWMELDGESDMENRNSTMSNKTQWRPKSEKPTKGAKSGQATQREKGRLPRVGKSREAFKEERPQEIPQFWRIGRKPATFNLAFLILQKLKVPN